MRKSTETYEHTINGLLQKRGELWKKWRRCMTARRPDERRRSDRPRADPFRSCGRGRSDGEGPAHRPFLSWAITAILIERIAGTRAGNDARAMRAACKPRKQGQARSAHDGGRYQPGREGVAPDAPTRPRHWIKDQNDGPISVAPCRIAGVIVILCNIRTDQTIWSRTKRELYRLIRG